MKKPTASEKAAPSAAIDAFIAELDDWRGDMIAHLRKLVREAAPNIVEDWKWGVPVWAHNGNVAAASAFKDHVKLNFFNGAAVSDPHGLFNAGLDAKGSRAIDFSEGDKLKEQPLKELIRAAVAHNGSKKKR
jgi:hypothetical protein